MGDGVGFEAVAVVEVHAARAGGAELVRGELLAIATAEIAEVAGAGRISAVGQISPAYNVA